jgi:short-subunit dehydrogenase
MHISYPSTKSFAVVTGASHGIGFELAKQFTDHGFDILVSAEDDGIEAAARLLSATGASVQSIQVDLANYDGVEKLYTRIQSCGRPVDAIAINAGVGVSGNFARDTELQAELNVIALNVTSSVHLAKRVVRDMVDRKKGRILFTSSMTGTLPVPFEAVYAASKAFLLSFSEALHSELHDFGVTVTALMPGGIESGFFQEAQKSDTAAIARDGFEALMAGRDQVIGGAFTGKLEGSLGGRMLTKNIRRNGAEPEVARKHGS